MRMSCGVVKNRGLVETGKVLDLAKEKAGHLCPASLLSMFLLLIRAAVGTDYRAMAASAGRRHYRNGILQAEAH